MPILDAHTLEFFSRSPEQTRRVGMRLGEHLEAGDFICLQGELGAGKTTLAQGLAQGWGTMDSVSSPTFILVNVYQRVDGGRLFHLDAYRLESVKEAEELDIDMMILDGPVLLEWPERFKTLIPSERMWINLDHIDEEQRKMRFEARGDRYDQLLSDLRRAAFGGN
ncbi:MAG: tRNA (adenosine(37)-N6)-threonylcarbamoyltransferase complex ATPase subunit type 1 TsaE [Chloroflexi bacterium RBG_16_51_16]|nr:MAG: tRNA (adenosine(37)-N6)-threonylcarbamoyltransferase complex ATPase subunit type 1 TsaE [Chloroflexi bacterium RBG_16_51_16]